MDRFKFRYLGRHGDYYAFRAPTWKTRARKSVDAVLFEAKVADWLFAEVDQDKWKMGNGVAPDFPELTMAYKRGSSICVLLKRITDVARFEQQFHTVGLTPNDLMAA